MIQTLTQSTNTLIVSNDKDGSKENYSGKFVTRWTLKKYFRHVYSVGFGREQSFGEEISSYDFTRHVLYGIIATKYCASFPTICFAEFNQ